MRILVCWTVTICMGIFGCSSKHEKGQGRADHDLPYYGQEKVVEDESGEPDTIPHKVPVFSLRDLQHNDFTHRHLEGRITVVDFFFTSCPTICPKMTDNLLELQKRLDRKEWDDIRILSITVDPAHDSVAVLRSYAEKKGIDTTRWDLLTGARERIYELGKEGFMVSARADSQAPGGFLHSGRFILVDPDRRIRGFYDGTKEASLDQVLEDIRRLRSKKI